MVNFFTGSQYEPNNQNFLGDMVVKWFHAGTCLTLVEINWYRNIQSSFHLLVEETNTSCTPVSLGVNQGWDEIQAAIKAQIPPPDLLKLILAKNPEMEALVLKHSPSTEALSMQAFLTQSDQPPKEEPQRTPMSFWDWLKQSKWVNRQRSL